MDLAEVLLLVWEPLDLEDAHFEAVLRPASVLCGGAESPPETDHDIGDDNDSDNDNDDNTSNAFSLSVFLSQNSV